MQLIRQGAARVAFEEDLHLAKEECRCLPYVAAILAAGWRLVKDGAPNHEDVLCGAKHLQDFKTTQRAKLSRVVVWRFTAKILGVHGNLFRVEQFAAQLVEDAALFRDACAHPKHAHFLNQLKHQLKHSPKARRSVMAADPHSNYDCVIAPMQGGDPVTMRAFARLFEHEVSL